MRISYKKLWMLLLERDIKRASLRHEVGLSAGTWTKLNKGEEVSLSILLRICDYLNCDIGDIWLRLCERTRTESGFRGSYLRWEEERERRRVFFGGCFLVLVLVDVFFFIFSV